MSSDSKERPKRLVRRSIPQLIPRHTDKSGESDSSPTSSQASRTNKNKLEKKLSNYRERVDDHPKTRPPLSLQGPFNPNIVGHRKALDESKRKRNPTPTRYGEKTPSPTASSLFSSVKLETEEQKSKRNHGKEKPKCDIDFAHKPDTTFAEKIDKSVVFTATAQSATTCSKRPPRDRSRKTSGSNTATNRGVDHRQTDKVLRENVQKLEEEKQQLVKGHAQKISELTSKLKSTQEALEKREKDNANLEKALEEQEFKDKALAEDNSKCLTMRNESLEKRLLSCQKKLEKLQVDPVSLNEMEKSNAEVILESQKPAVEEAAKLRQTLKSINKKNQEIIEKFKETKENIPTDD